MNNAPRIIVIAGFMGAGKTSVACALARLLGCGMIDLDRLICERHGRAPHAIIEQDGEQHFRQLETRAFEHALKRAGDETKASQDEASETETSYPAQREASHGRASMMMKRGEYFIVALGGGAWTIERNRALAVEHGAFSVWLDAPFELCWHRITTQAGDAADARPLAREREQARSLYDARREFYALASLRVGVAEGASVESLAAEIAAAVSC